MGLLARLLGCEIPDRRTILQKGFFWKADGVPALAATRGFNQEVVGESFHFTELQEATGGPTKYGVKIDCPALLIATQWRGEPCVRVAIGSTPAGSLPKEDAPAIHSELLSLTSDGRATCKGRIQAGFEGGHYSVKLSLARPLRGKA